MAPRARNAPTDASWAAAVSTSLSEIGGDHERRLVVVRAVAPGAVPSPSERSHDPVRGAADARRGSARRARRERLRGGGLLRRRPLLDSRKRRALVPRTRLPGRMGGGSAARRAGRGRAIAAWPLQAPQGQTREV